MDYLSNIFDKQSFKDSIKQSLDLKALERIEYMKREIASNILGTGEQ